MNDDFCISFMPGTSGRFLANLLWDLISKKSFNWSIKSDNSAHTGACYSISTGPDCIELRTSRQVYERFERFYKDHHPMMNPMGKGLLVTHQYPKWDIIRSKPGFANTKFIIITINKDNFLEITANDFYKNVMDTLNPDTPDNNQMWPFWIHRMYKNIIGPCSEEDLYQRLLIKENSLKIIKQLMYNTFYEIPGKTAPEDLQQGYANKINFFNDAIVPNDFKDKVLLLTYDDIFASHETNYYVALDKLLTFTGMDHSDILPKTLETYHHYVNGRNNFVDTYVNN